MFIVYRTRNKRDEIVAECDTKEEAMKYTRPSEWNKQNDDFVYNPKLANVLSLGKEK